MGGHVINNLSYVDDTVIIAESNNQLQQLMDTVVKESEARGLFLNSAKSFTMVCSKSEVRHTCKITVHGNTLEQVDRIVYLGNLFTSDGRCEQDVRQRIAIAKCCCCLPTPMTFASGETPMFPLVVHQPASPSIWPAVQSLRRALSINPEVTIWCVCGCS